MMGGRRGRPGRGRRRCEGGHISAICEAVAVFRVAEAHGVAVAHGVRLQRANTDLVDIGTCGNACNLPVTKVFRAEHTHRCGY